MAAVLASNVLSVIVSKYFSRKKESVKIDAMASEEWKSLYSEIQKERTELKKAIEKTQEREIECQRQLSIHQIEIETLKADVRLFRSFRQALPIAWWVKDINGKMVELSDEYERVYLIPNGLKREDYIGKTDIEMWGEKIGRMYMAADNEVIQRGATVKVYEIVDINGDTIKVRSEKSPIIFGEIVWGTMGFCIPEEWEPTK